MVKIDYVFLSSNENPFYLDFWPVVSRAWRKMGITPVLIKITNKDTLPYKDANGIIKEVKRSNKTPQGLQAQLARYYFTKLFPNNFCLISDIDMLPLKKDYFFNRNIKQTANSFIVFNSDFYPQNYQRYLTCYLLAKGKIYSEILNRGLSFENFCKEVYSKDKTFFADEKYLYQAVKSWKGRKILIEGKQYLSSNSLGRNNWKYDPAQIVKGKYHEAHLIRPYKSYKSQIDYLASLVENSMAKRTTLKDYYQQSCRFIYRIWNPEKADRLKGKSGLLLKRIFPKFYHILRKKYLQRQ
ncbi:hypothetical protein KA107_00270 [Candidatus Pacearchaeota archaeon]|nr:hypothetical protein [Candidatus Pacearchaeota archaeon]